MREGHAEQQSALAGDDPALAALVLLLSFLDRPADPEPLRHLLGKGSERLTADDLVRLGKRFNVRTRKVTAKAAQLERMRLPAIAAIDSEDFVVLLQLNADKALVFGAMDDRPRVLARADFDSVFGGVLVLMTTRERIAGAARAFDVSWFIPALVRYRHILRDVLIASFFLQVLASITPLFFQVVTDKVLVHNGLTTLEILAIGLLVVSLFDVGIGGLRDDERYLVGPSRSTGHCSFRLRTGLGSCR